MKYVPKKIPEGINVSPVHPLIHFTYLLGTVIIISALFFIILGFIAEWLATQISPEMEKKIGQQLYQMIASDEKQDDKRVQYLEELLYSLPQSGENVRLPLIINLVESDIVNAAIMVGGHVFINTGLLDVVKSENELAFVLAHELGHFQAYDPTKSMGRSLVFVIILAILGIGTSESGGVPNIIPITFTMNNLNYSRQQEKTADLYGLSRVIKYYGHGGGSLEFFKHLQKTSFKISEYFSTHPLNDARINALNIYAAENGWLLEGTLTPLPIFLQK